MNKIYMIMLVVLVVLVLVVAAVVMRRRSGVVGGGAFRLKVSDPEYTAMLDGKKTVEARLDRPPFSRLAVGDPVVVVRSRPAGDTSEYPGGKYKFDAEVARVDKYKNIDALLKAEGPKTYPGKSAAEASARFSAYLPPGTAATEPVIAIELRRTTGAAKKPSKKTAERLGRGESDDPYDSYDF